MIVSHFVPNKALSNVGELLEQVQSCLAGTDPDFLQLLEEILIPIAARGKNKLL
jgi:hypothetical protein